MPTLALETVSDDLLVRQFRHFYEELERIWQTAPPCSSSAEAIVLARQVSRQLENLIEMQSLEYRQGGSRFAQQAAEDARYIKAALADEVLLRQDWSGREIWSQHLLEATMFRSSVAGKRCLTISSICCVPASPHSERWLSFICLRWPWDFKASTGIKTRRICWLDCVVSCFSLFFSARLI